MAICEEEEARELTGMAIGGVTVIGLPKDLPIYVDEGLIEFDYVILGAATVRRRSRSLRRCFLLAERANPRGSRHAAVSVIRSMPISADEHTGSLSV